MTSVPEIILLGVSGAGKTTVGKLLAQRLNLDFLDADDVVEALSGSSLNDLIVNQDENLGQLRKDAASTVLSKAGSIAALGASQIEDPDTRKLIEEARAKGARIIELALDSTELAKRTGLNKPRSVGLGAPRAMLGQMLTKLREAYASVADSSVNTVGLTPDDVVERVLEACKLAGDYVTPKE